MDDRAYDPANAFAPAGNAFAYDVGHTGGYAFPDAHRSPEEDAIDQMSPVDALKLRTELENRHQVSPEQASANRWQNLKDVGYATPIVGNVMSAADVPEQLNDAAYHARQGDEISSRKAMIMAELSGLGAMLGLPIGRTARAATEGASSSANIFAGPKAATANHVALSRAQEMEMQGAGRDDIWRATGWGRGRDGAWRHEIDDSGADVLHPALHNEFGDLKIGQGSTLAGSEIQHPDLHAAYPEGSGNEFSNASILIGKKFQPNGAYRAADDAMLIEGRNPEMLRTVGLHEMQHGVQNREGFETGASPSTLRNQYIAAAQPHIDVLTNDFRQRLEADPHLDDLYYAYRMANDAAGRNHIRNEIAQAPGGTDLLRLRDQIDSATSPGVDWFDIYRRHAGEVEARNVETRRNMTADERRASPPWLTQDVPDEQQIVRNAFGRR